LDRQIIKLFGNTSVIDSLLVFYFSNDSLFSNWEKLHKSHQKYYDYLAWNQEFVLDDLSKILGTDRIKSLKGSDFRQSVESRISNLFSDVLESIEDSKMIR